MDLDPVTLSALLLSIQGSFDWGGRDQRFKLVDSWERPRSGSIFYVMEGTTSAIKLVVKTSPGWSTDTPGELYDNLLHLDDIVNTSGIDMIHGVRPLGWAEDPPVLVMPWVEGEDLISIMRRPHDDAWSRGLIAQWMQWAGVMLARYHLESDPATPVELERSTKELAQISSKLRISETRFDSMLTRVDLGRASRRRYGDFGPGNLHGAPDGALYLLDPPGTRSVSVLHRDIANFLFELRRQLAGHGFTRYPPIKGQFESLRAQFLSGYLGQWPELQLGADDQALVALFEAHRATGMAIKRFPNRPADTYWFGRLALERRSRVSEVLRS
jgi:hypothetical protein